MRRRRRRRRRDEFRWRNGTQQDLRWTEERSGVLERNDLDFIHCR